MIDISIGIGMILCAAQFSSTNPTETEKYAVAARSAAEASYKQSGMEKDIQKLEEKYVSKEVREYAGQAMIYSRLIIEQRIELRWEW